MSHYYPKDSDTNLKKRSITNSQVMEYAKDKHSLKPKRKTSTLSLADIKKEINESRPVYIGCEGSGTYKKAHHALLVRGYNTSNNYSVWNPWYKYCETMSSSTKIYK